MTMCGMKLSPQHQIFSLYHKTVNNVVKNSAVMAFAYMWRTEFIGHNYTEEIQELENTLTQKINEYTELFKNKLQVMPNFIRRCDPIEQKKDVTYAEFENLVYVFVTNQKTFEPKNKETCENFCGDIVTSTPECEKKNNCKKYETICKGKITGCKNDASYEVCQSNDSSSRHYDWIKNKDNNVYYGNASTSCTSTKLIESTNILTWLPSWASKICRGCICQCVDDRLDTNNKTIRAFSYMWSNTSDDMVATGARLVAQDRMIHIQLREAKLLPLGNINVTSERWIPLPKFEYQNNFPSVAIYPDGTRHSLIADRDFGTIQMNFADKICLQQLILDEKYLLTGVRFNAMYFNNTNKDEKRCFNIDTNYAEFNYDTGKMMTRKSYDKQQTQPTELILDQPDNPLKFKKNVQDSMDNQYIKIGVTDLIKDASQTTFPFIDLQEVTTKPSAPLAGIELFHKGQLDKTSGGFVSLKIHPIDFSIFI
ncbi:uncharacterized protein LOC122850126 [Aphidius gifuensis]|nr:uncharacterized protein LOC122850126 [Aphidius gifuensis]